MGAVYPNTGCGREQASVPSRKSQFVANSQPLVFTDITRRPRFTPTAPTCLRPKQFQIKFVAAASRFLVLAWTDRPLLSSSLPAQCRPLLGVTGTNHSYNLLPKLSYISSLQGAYQLDPVSMTKEGDGRWS